MKKIIDRILIICLLISSLAYSQTPTKESVTKLYVATFNRAPDADGLNYWLNDSGLSLEGIARSFFEQPETQALYPPDYSDHDFIKAVYENLFNREPDSQGWSYWENELQNNPSIDRSIFILAIINGALDDDAVILSNKTEVGEYFADKGLNDLEKEREVMENIDASSESVQNALNMIDSWVGGSEGDTTGWNDNEKDALTYLNEIRNFLGMPKFSAESHLHQAAQAHSQYNVANNLFGHYESSSYPYYTGDAPVDRAIAAGYPSTWVTENIASASDYKDNVDGLFTAIYHRLGFLNFTTDEIGIGEADNSGYYVYTYDMGNKRLREFCERGVSDYNGAGYYMLPCTDQNIQLSAEKYYEYLNISNKDYIYYPVGEIDKGIFTTESPYPIPGYNFSGNPVSIFFNSNLVDCSSITVNSFSLRDTTTDREVGVITLMDKNSDPNGRFSDCDFAIFPSQREEFGHNYKATFNYSDQSGNHTIEWTFSIKTPTTETDHLLNADEDYNEFTIKRGEDYYIYIPPTQDNPRISGYSYSYDRPEIETIDWYDDNTIHIKIFSSSAKGYIDMSINNIEVYLNVE